MIISLKINLFSPWYSWKIAELALSNTHSLTTMYNTYVLQHKQIQIQQVLEFPYIMKLI